MRYLTLAEIVNLHRMITETTGGASGIRDLGVLESAVVRMHVTRHRRFVSFTPLLASLSAVHVLPIADLFNDNEFLAVINRINDSIIALTNSVAVLFACKLFRATRTWFRCQSTNPYNDFFAVFFRSERFKLFCRRRFNLEFIACRAA